MVNFEVNFYAGRETIALILYGNSRGNSHDTIAEPSLVLETLEDFILESC